MTTSKTKKIGKYEILDVLGKGGMGVVYKAIDPSIGRLVAIKMITSNFADDPGFLKRFYREAQSTGKLQHPNIVIVHDLGEFEGNPFLVMEFLEGISMDTIIREERTLPLIEKLNLIIQACAGLQYAHDRNIVHRDIKPGNVMVVNQGETVKIVDFGIARIEDEGNVTLPSQVIGTIQYMSPEQINGKPVDGRSDVFSLAVVLYQLLTFRLPFAGKDTGSTLLKIINEPPSPLSKYLEAYPAELDTIVQRGLAKSREDRYQTADELAFDLTQVQEQLRRAAVTEYLVVAEDLLARGELGKAREQCLQIVRVDRQNSRAKELLQEVQQRIKKQQRGEQAHQLLSNAQEAYAAQEFERALLYLEQAVELDSENHDLKVFRDSVSEAKSRAEQRRNALKRAQSAQYAGDLTEALSAVEQAIALDTSDSEARALCTEIKLEIEQRKRQMEIQGLVEDAQRQISSRRFTAALEALKKAQTLDPTAPVITELVSLAATGQEQERRRKELDRLTISIQDALNQDAFQLASERCDEALKQFPDERGILKLKSIADRQRQAAEKRQFIEEQITGARKLLDSKQTDAALQKLEAACSRYPNEAALISVLTIIQQTLQQEKAEASKNDYIQRSKEALRGKRFDEAIRLLETGFAELNSPELEDLLQFAVEEKATFVRRQQVEAAMQEAQRLMAAEEYEQAISFLRGTLKEITDDDLDIILSDAERHVDEFNRRVGEAVETAERLLRVDRPAEAVRFLESQPDNFSRSPRFREITGRAHDCQERLQNILAAVEKVQMFIGCRDWAGGQSAVDECRRAYGDHPELSRVASQIEAGRRESATAVVNKATADSRMLLMGRSYDSALELLDSVGPSLEFIAEDLRLRHTALREEAERGMARRQQEIERAGDGGRAAPAGEDTQERTVWKAPGQNEAEARPELKERDLDELQKLANDAETIASVDELRAVSARARVLAMRNGDDEQVQSVADGVSKKVTTRIDALTSIGSPDDASATQYGYEPAVFRQATPPSVPVEGGKFVAPLAEPVKEEPRKVEPVVTPLAPPPVKPVEPVKEEPRKVEQFVAPLAPPPVKPVEPVKEEPRKVEQFVAPLAPPPVKPVEPVKEEPRKVEQFVAPLAPPPVKPVEPVKEEPRKVGQFVAPLAPPPVKPVEPVKQEPRKVGQFVAPLAPPPVKPVEPVKEEPRKVEQVVAPVTPPPAKPVEPVKEVPRKIEPAVPPSAKKAEVPKNPGSAPASASKREKPPAPVPPRAAPTPVPTRAAAPVPARPHVQQVAPPPAPSLWARLPKGVTFASLGLLVAVAIGIIVWKSNPSGTTTENKGPMGGAMPTVTITSNPAGATVEVNNETCITPGCKVKLSPGDYELKASLAGYAPLVKNVRVEVGSSAPMELTFTPLPSRIHIKTNLSRGEARIDGRPAGRLQEGQLTIPEVSVGQHTLKVFSKKESAEIGFQAVTAGAPEIGGTLSAQNVSALIVANRSGQLRVLCNCSDGTQVMLDGRPVSPIAGGRQDLGAVPEGSHQIQIGTGENARTHIVNVSGQPALDIFLDAESTEGILVVQTGVDKATVYLDGRKSGQTGSDGVYRKSLPIKSVSVTVTKDGYRNPPAQIAEVKKNGETGVSFSLQPVAQKATLLVAGGQPNASISLDGQGLGSLDGAGRYSGDVSPGNHTVEVAKAGFETKKQNMSFAAGNTVRLDASMKPLPPPVQPKQEPKVEDKPPVVVKQPPPPPPPVVASDQPDQRVRPDKGAQAVLEKQQRLAQIAADQTGVLVALGRYSDAYEHKSTDELEAVWPSLLKQDRKKISDSFKSAVAIQMKLRPTGEPSVSGDSAVVTCDRDLIYTFQGGVQKTFSGQVTIRLQKKSGTWLIEGTS
jgi:serine/threonine-protein kinase